METNFPFSPAFGLASTRKNCILSAERLYGKILKRQNKSDSRDVLNFATLGAIALKKDSTLDQAKVRKLKQVFRPGRQGELSVLDWCKSCDAVYKEMRFLSSSINNASQIDRAYEKILNVLFYTLLAIVVFAMLGISALSFILSLSSILVAFAFMIGPASSTYFDVCDAQFVFVFGAPVIQNSLTCHLLSFLQGILLILARRPYDIGDRIAVSDVNQDTNMNGSLGWVVENIDLFTTTLRYGSSREVATLSNGSLARSRIINMTRSDKAQVYVYLKFSVDEPYSKVKLFRKAVESFVRERPREWICLSAFRATRVETDLGYIEYAVTLQHRESWNMVTEIFQSKADVSSFCLELQKQLEMRYHAPALPVDLAMNMTAESNDTNVATGENTSNKLPTTPTSRESLDDNVRAIARMFESKKAK
jgi:small-conductance mechanosensitive channel